MFKGPYQCYYKSLSTVSLFELNLTLNMDNWLKCYCIQYNKCILFCHGVYYIYMEFIAKRKERRLTAGRLCYWKVAGSIPLVCMSNCPWARCWTPNCQLCWLAATAISDWMYIWMTVSHFGEQAENSIDQQQNTTYAGWLVTSKTSICGVLVLVYAGFPSRDALNVNIIACFFVSMIFFYY